MQPDPIIYRFSRKPGEAGPGSIQVEHPPAPEAISLDPRLDLVNHSPDGFQWGYAGSGPAQAALAILAHFAGDEVAMRHHQAFKRRVIAAITDDSFALKGDRIRAFLGGRDEAPEGDPLADMGDKLQANEVEPILEEQRREDAAEAGMDPEEVTRLEAN